MTGPYGDFARQYLAAGWSPLPLPPRRKKPPPDDWTGRGKPMASAADVEAWCEERPDANIALRLPPGVIGIDADTYKGDAEAAAWHALIDECGPLPDAPWSTSRDDGISGIRLFTVPDGYIAADMGPAGEVIQHHHRYVVAPPSISPPPPLGSAQPYRWVGAPDGYVPNVADLPPLPEVWLNRLRAAAQAASVNGMFQQPGTRDTTWTNPNVAELATGGLRADAAQDSQLRDLVFECVRQGMSEHTVQAVWLAAVTRTPVKRPGDPWTDADFARHYRGAVKKTDPEDEDGDAPLAGLRVVSLADVEPEHIDWLWDGYLPLGKIVTLDGDPGVGKSTVTSDLAARVSTGSPMPDGSPGKKGTVLILSAEDGLADTIRPRLDAAGADPARVITITEMTYPTEDGPQSRPVTIPGDLAAIERIIAEHDVRLVIVDVLMAYLSGDYNAHRDQDVRRALHVLAALAERTHCCVIVLRHLNKSGGPNALYRGGGSIGIIGAARAGFMCGRDPEDETGQLRVLANIKMNIATEPPALGYKLVPDQLHGCGRIEWLGHSQHSAADLLAEPRSEDDRTERDEAAEWLTGYLTDQGGEASFADLVKAARANGHAERTLRRSAKRAGIGIASAGFPRRTIWALPEAVRPQSGQSGQDSEAGRTGRTVAALAEAETPETSPADPFTATIGALQAEFGNVAAEGTS